MLFPEPWRQFGNPSRGVLPDELEHIDEIGVRLDAAQSAGDNQTLDDTDVPGAELSPTKEPGLALMRSFA